MLDFIVTVGVAEIVKLLISRRCPHNSHKVPKAIWIRDRPTSLWQGPEKL